MKLPCLGSVKLTSTLPRGICYEASIRRENGRWYICLKLWKPPEHKPERACRPGGIDTGINPLGTDSDGGESLPKSQRPSYEVQKKLRRGGSEPRLGDRRVLPGLVGSPAEDRQVPPAHPGTETHAQHQMTSTGYKEVQRARHRGPQRRRE